MTRKDFIEFHIDELLGLLLGGMASSEGSEGQNEIHRAAIRGRFYSRANERAKCLLGRIFDVHEKWLQRTLTVDEIIAEFMDRYGKLTVDKHSEVKEKLRKALGYTKETQK